jgi:hypothetical protein
VNITQPVKGTEAEVRRVTVEKLTEDLRAVVANEEEVKATSLIF